MHDPGDRSAGHLTCQMIAALILTLGAALRGTLMRDLERCARPESARRLTGRIALPPGFLWNNDSESVGSLLWLWRSATYELPSALAGIRFDLAQPSAPPLGSKPSPMSLPMLVFPQTDIGQLLLGTLEIDGHNTISIGR